MDEYEQVKRGRGRPKGSRNKPKAIAPESISTATIKEAYPDMSRKELNKSMIETTGMSLNSMNRLEGRNKRSDAGERAKAAQFILECQRISQYADRDNIETLYTCFNAYIELCMKFDYTISNMTAYMAIGIHRRDIDRWADGERRKDNPAYKEFAEMVRNVCSAARELYGMKGKVNPILTIFHQKAFDGLSDQPMPVREDSSPLGEMKDAESLAMKNIGKEDTMKKEILSTTDYAQFNKLKGNRAVPVSRLNKIIASINRVGYITSPIIVNEKMEVIDGQGRLKAMMMKGLPVEYVIHPGIGIKECISMNIDQVNWTMMDYIKSYAEQGNENYCRMLRLIEDYPDVSIRAVYSALFGTANIQQPELKSGLLEVSDEDVCRAEEVLSYINKFEPYMKKAKFHRFVFEVALIYTFWNKDVDLDRMYERVTSNISVLKPFRSVLECLDSLSEIYNYRIGGKGRIYLNTEYQKTLVSKSCWFGNNEAANE